MKLNEYECGMLDALLTAFDKEGTLTARQLEERFAEQKVLLPGLIDILVQWGLVTVSGHDEETGLPMTVHRGKSAIAFLQNGGFSGNKQLLIENDVIHRKKYAQRIRKLETKLSNLDQENYRLWVILGLIVVITVVLLLVYHSLLLF